jgi:hypothetical protein
MSEIKLIQSPIITHDLVSIGRSVTQRLEDLNIDGQVATEDTVKALKTLRIELNKELADYELQRKTVKEAVMNPYSEFESVYKEEVSDKYKAAVEKLKDKIAFVEDKIKAEKRENVLTYFAELCLAEDIDFLTFDKVGLDINLSTTEKAYKEKCFEFVGKVSEELRLIDTQKDKAEILVEYKKTLNAAKAIREVQERKEAERIEKDRIQMMETQRRQKLLVGLSMVFHDLTKTYNWVQDETVYITLNDIETLPTDTFRTRFAQIEEEIKSKKVPTLGELQKQYTQPLQAPLVTAPPVVEYKEEVFTAVFECLLTMKQAGQLKEFLISNNITYKNI